MSAVVISVRPEAAAAQDCAAAAQAQAVLDQMFAYYTPEPLPPVAEDQAEYDLVA